MATSLATLKPAPTSLVGRFAERHLLTQAIEGGPGRILTLIGPTGSGKTALLTEVLRGRGALHLQGAPLPEGDLLEDLELLARERFGQAPVPIRPGVLPSAPGRGGWPSLLAGIRDRVEHSGAPLVLALDGMEFLLQARRRLAGELRDLAEGARARGLPFTLVLTARRAETLDFLRSPEGASGSGDLHLELGPLPFRAAGWAHGGRSPRDAFLRWALFGDDPSHLGETESPGADGELEDRVLRRVLDPGGDLHDAPLRRLEAAFQRPARYASVLRALSRGPLAWSEILERAHGLQTGAQLAPYLRRLEEEGLVRVTRPLDAGPDRRARRYAVADPFVAFWFGWVLPLRSLLSDRDPRAIWRERILPSLAPHLQAALAEAGRRWLRDHAEELFGVPAREAGGLWGGEAEFDMAGRLGNGQVCYGLVDWAMQAPDLAGEMGRRMSETRYGLGRQARAALYLLGGRGNEALRREVARRPLARIIDLRTLMGEGPPPDPGA